MGFFAVYCGLIYNDFLSVPLELGDSCFDLKTRQQKQDCVYPFGVDYMWFESPKELNFMNSLKMKIAVIIGFL